MVDKVVVEDIREGAVPSNTLGEGIEGCDEVGEVIGNDVAVALCVSEEVPPDPDSTLEAARENGESSGSTDGEEVEDGLVVGGVAPVPRSNFEEGKDDESEDETTEDAVADGLVIEVEAAATTRDDLVVKDVDDEVGIKTEDRDEVDDTANDKESALLSGIELDVLVMLIVLVMLVLLVMLLVEGSSVVMCVLVVDNVVCEVDGLEVEGRIDGRVEFENMTASRKAM